MASGIAWLFPGQGSQIVGMGRDLAERYVGAARAFEEADDALGFDLRALCWSGPQSDLDRTANTQPALLTASIAALRSAEEATGGLDEPVVARSEEHTSELQSPDHLVCRLLLEKKKTRENLRT